MTPNDGFVLKLNSKETNDSRNISVSKRSFIGPASKKPKRGPTSAIASSTSLSIICAAQVKTAKAASAKKAANPSISD